MQSLGAATSLSLVPAYRVGELCGGLQGSDIRSTVIAKRSHSKQFRLAAQPVFVLRPLCALGLWGEPGWGTTV